MPTRSEISPAVLRLLKEKNLTADEVLRKALNIKAEGFTTSDGIHFPEGTVFVAIYKETAPTAIVKEGTIRVDGKAYSSLSAAAARYTGRPTTNGWDFWYVKMPGKPDLVPAKILQEQQAA